MIHVKRDRVPAPTVFSSARINAERDRAQEFFSIRHSARAQTRFDFKPEFWEQSRRDLYRLFRGKCAYCESRMKVTEAQLDHFRPTNNAKSFDGTTQRDYYWWLAYEWGNLYPACAECQRAKATLFPIEKGSERAGPGTDLRREHPLLLDPCDPEVIPDAHLAFLENGRVVAAARVEKNDLGYRRAEASIDVFALNRKDLVQGRAKAIAETVAGCERIASRGRRLVAGTGATMSQPDARVKKLLTPWYPYLAARRQAALRALRAMGAYGRQIIDLVPQLQSGKLAPAKSTLPVARATRQRRTAYITEITIENFKSIRRLELSFKTDQPGTAPIPESLSLPPPSAVETSTPPKALASPTPTRPAWKVLLGENGTGKSSVLQATALALAGAHSLRNLKITSWEKILRRPRGNRAGPKAGFVRVGLSTGDDVELRFNAKTAWFTSGPAGAQTLLRGYGPTRNLPTTRPPAGWKKVEAMVRIGNLFDSNDPMCSAERWLVNLEPARFNTAALALKDLLGLQQGDRIRCVRRKPSLIDSRKKQICVDFGPTTVGFDELSDGYQSMIALAVDIMAGLPKTSADFQSDTGIVLLDELGTHLHPRWRMRVVRSLQNAFPRLQFFASTHEPLCIRGLRRSEVSVLERIGQHVIKIADEDLPDPEPMRIDQLLTSRYFGLESTIDPEMDRKFQEYYRLLGQVSLTPAEQSRLALLEAEINRQPRALGFTRRDQLVYEIIDEYLARDLRLQGPEERTRLRESTKQKVAEIFHQVMLLAEPLQ